MVIHDYTHRTLSQGPKSSSVDKLKISALPHWDEHGRVSHIFHSIAEATNLASVTSVEDGESVGIYIVLDAVHPVFYPNIAFTILLAGIEELLVHCIGWHGIINSSGPTIHQVKSGVGVRSVQDKVSRKRLT